ncbi:MULTISPECIES: hypothetical protein [Micromonospora]|uniref:DUF4233 domain-containing protein n=1 Tax=Micromonospora yangpuensis TaxID=683228 RepID=A0A1C6UN79_9ACTN|nr:hypothetical protein [Micromonospora yangpuensis]GGM28145.1 hypothetical protein GCM10012279_53450 [Micromonospora yangpuensis]SCL55359.1 hypothetical protein GA0070617_2935 [Micromonospora yangpuensis]
MVVRINRRSDPGLLQHPPMPGTVQATVLIFALLALLFALATVHRLVAEDGSLGAAGFFAAMAGASTLVTVALAGRRRWAAYPTYVVTILLATASLGLFGAITIVGLGLLAWVVFALSTRAARDWLSGRRRLR